MEIGLGFDPTGERRLGDRTVDFGHAVTQWTHPGWMTSVDDLWWIPEHLVGVRHTRLLTGAATRSLSRVDRRSLAPGLVGFRSH